MDNLNTYRNIIEKVLTEIANLAPSKGDVREVTIFDRNSDNYAIISLGWEKARRIHHCVAHIEIFNDKVWVQENNVDFGIASELECAGIPKNDIVLGFHPPDVRPYTEYAVA